MKEDEEEGSVNGSNGLGGAEWGQEQQKGTGGWKMDGRRWPRHAVGGQ